MTALQSLAICVVKGGRGGSKFRTIRRRPKHKREIAAVPDMPSTDTAPKVQEGLDSALDVGPKPYDFAEIADPILRAIRFAYDLTRKNPRRTIPWRGPDIGWQERACCPSPRERLRAGNLAYVEEDQGRDALEEIISVAIQLGIEQGRRITMHGNELKTLRIRLMTAKLGLERLGSMEAFNLARMIDPEQDAELLARIEYARKFHEAVR